MCPECLGLQVIYPDTQNPVPCPTCFTKPLARVRALVQSRGSLAPISVDELKAALLGLGSTQLVGWKCPECGQTGADDPNKQPMYCDACMFREGAGKWVEVEWAPEKIEAQREELYPEASPHPRCKRPNCEEHEFPGLNGCMGCAQLRAEDRERSRL